MSRPTARFVATGGETLHEVVERSSAGAIGEGRVFVDGRRVTNGDVRLAAGSVVEIYARREEDAVGALRVLRRVGGLVFVDKPAGIATEPERRGATGSVVHRVAAELGVRPDTVHASTRLDVGVSGVVVLSLDAAARRRVQEARERGALRRRYVALAAGTPRDAQGEWRDAIGKRGRGPLRQAQAEGARGGAPALTRYRVVESLGDGSSVLALDPATGRTHQLRVHAGAHGAPLYGDRSYGGPVRVVAASGAVTALGRVFLHCAWVALPELGRVEAPLPEALEQLWAALGGAPEALLRACDADGPG